MQIPVRNDARADARKQTRSAMSSGRAIRPSGYAPSTSARCCSRGFPAASACWAISRCQRSVADAAMDLARGALHFLEPTEIAGHDEWLGARLPRDLRGRGLQRRLVARAQRDAGALGGEPAGDGAADAPARPGHEGDLLLELEV